MGSHEGNSLEPVGQTKPSHEGCREGEAHLASMELQGLRVHLYHTWETKRIPKMQLK